MALTHSHRVVVRDLDDSEMNSNHLDATGREYGHDEHVQLVDRNENAERHNRTDEHTHEDVDEVYDRRSDSVLHLPQREGEEREPEKEEPEEPEEEEAEDGEKE